MAVMNVRILRRIRLRQTRGRNFMRSPFPRRGGLSRGVASAARVGGVRVVRDHHDRLVVIAIERLQQVEDFVSRLAIEVAGRLVAEQHRRVGDDRPGDADALFLTAGELPGVVVARSARPTTESAVWTRLRSAPPSLVSSSGSSTLRAAVNTGSRLHIWKTNPMWRARQAASRRPRACRCDRRPLRSIPWSAYRARRSG